MSLVWHAEEIVFALPEKGHLRITKEAVTDLVAYRQPDPDDHEAGGILLGRLMYPSGDITIDSVTAPSQGDQRSRFMFWRAREPHQKRVNDAWEASDGTRNYLGDWHSHPEDYPEPSGHDKKNWRKIVREARYEQDDLVFLIVGREWIGAWSLRREQRSPRELNRVDVAATDVPRS